MVEYAKILSEDIVKSQVLADMRHVDLVKGKLEKNAGILLKVQELITNQIYYIGLHQDSY